MMLSKLNPFKKATIKKIQCFSCQLSYPEQDMFKLVYKAADGAGSVFLCPFCSKNLEDMKGSITSV
jgi:hypothetical protein